MVQIDTRLPMAIQQPNILASLDAGTRAAGNQAGLMRQAEGQNLFRQYGAGAMQGDQNALAAIAGFDPKMAQGMQANNLGMELTREQIAAARRSAAEAARSQEDARAAAAELAQARKGMQMAGQAFLSGDQRAWNMVAQEFGVPGIPMNEQGLAFLDAIVSGFDEGLAGLAPQNEGFRQVRGSELGLTGDAAERLFNVGPDGKVSSIGGGGVTVNTGDQGPRMGTIPQGYAVVPDEANPAGYRMAPIPGGPEDTTDEDAKAAEARATSANIVLDEISLARDLIEGQGLLSPATGLLGAAASRVDQTRAGKLKNRLETIKANIGFDKLQSMRDASPTGGALGQVSEFENRLLQAVYGSLVQAQDGQELLYNLERLEDIYKRIVHVGIPEREARRLYNEVVGGAGAPAPAEAPQQPEGPGAWVYDIEAGELRWEAE